MIYIYMILLVILYLFDLIHFLWGCLVRGYLLPLLCLMAGCASQIPDGIYENQTPDSTMRLYIGYRENMPQIPCLLGIVDHVHGRGISCKIEALDQDRYRLLFLSEDGQPMDMDGDFELNFELHYKPQTRVVMMTLTGVLDGEERTKEIRLPLLPGTEDPTVNPPLPKMSRSDDAIENLEQDIPAQPIPAAPKS